MAKLKEKPVEKTLANNTAENLRVLFVEDSEDDMMLELIELKQAGYTVDSIRVQDAAALENALQDSWDLVLSDYNMPSFSGKDALQIIQEHKLDVPFILVTGMIGEIAAVNMMKSGAHDYILKDNMARLVPAVQRELKEAQIRKEHQESQQALQQNEQRLLLALNASGQAPWDLNLLTMQSTVSEEHANMLGYKLNEFDRTEKAFAESLHPEDRDRVFAAFNTYLSGESSSYQQEFRMKTKSGAWKWIYSMGEIVSRDKNNKPLRMVGTHTDIDERKLTEATLVSKSSQLAEAQAIGQMGNWRWDIKDNSLYWSDEIYRIFDLQPQSSMPNFDNFINAIHPDDRKPVQTAIDNALHNMQPYSIDHRIRLADGSIRFVHEQGKVRFDDNADPSHMIGTIQDITERKLAEQMLQKSETRFRATFEQAAVGIAHVSPEGKWLRANQRLCEIIGYERDELVKTTFQDITYIDDLNTDLSLVQEMLDDKRQHYTMEKRYIRKDGSITWINLTVSLVRKQNNEPDYFISVIEDINDRKAAEARIQATLEEKDIVLRELHHRVKNNMQVISSLLSLQARYANINNPQEALQESRQRIRAMAMIHERLYGSDDLASVDFLDYLRYLAERLSRIYHEVGADIKIQVSGEPLQLPIDHALPCALISNELITNTIKHAYKPEQTERLLEIRIANVSSSQSQIIFRDYGQGIDTTLLNTSPNTLGLVIVNALTRQLGGTIDLESLNGTTATLTFPSTSTYNNRLK